jgi:DNA-binding MarR family transcriptional regulator
MNSTKLTVVKDTWESAQSAIERIEWMSSLAGMGLPLSAIRVGLALAGRLNGQTGQLNPSSPQLQQDTGLSKRAVTYAVKDLEDAGLIQATRSTGRGHTIKYQLILKKRAQGTAPFNKERVQASVVKGASQRQERVQALATGTQEVNTGRTQGEKTPAGAAKSPNPKTVVELYHKHLPDSPAVRKLTKAREAQIKARLKTDLKTVEAWVEFFKYVADSDFLTGQAESHNGRKPFVANLEWLTRESNFVKVIEGNYADRNNANTDG